MVSFGVPEKLEAGLEKQVGALGLLIDGIGELLAGFQ